MEKRQCGRCGYEIEPKDNHYNKEEEQYECALCVDEYCQQYMNDNYESISEWVSETVYQKFYQNRTPVVVPPFRDEEEDREEILKKIEEKLKKIAN